MYKYRRLSQEELELLEDSFIRFLAAQSIAGEDWKKIQENNPSRHDELIDKFSDVVIEKTLHNVKILEERSERRILFFRFGEEKVELFGIEFRDTPPFPLDGGFELKAFAELLQKEDVDFSILSGHKPYNHEKLLEIYDIMSKGAQIPANDELFNLVLKYFDNNN